MYRKHTAMCKTAPRDAADCCPTSTGNGSYGLKTVPFDLGTRKRRNGAAGLTNKSTTFALYIHRQR